MAKANTKLLVALLLLQILTLHVVAVSATKHHKPVKPGASNGTCRASGVLHGKAGKCNPAHGSDCCVAGRSYPQFRCSPPVSAKTPAILTINSFEKGGDGGGPSECDNHYHSDKEKVVALSTGWFSNRARCGKMVRVTASNGRSVLAKVVDECDSVQGCDKDHNFEPPCPNNVVDGSPAVWKALGLDEDLGEVKVTWSDA